MYTAVGAHSEEPRGTHPFPVDAFSLPAVLAALHCRLCVLCVLICTGQPP